MVATFTPGTPTVSSLSDFMLFEKQGGEKLASSVSWYPIHLLQAGGLKHWQQKSGAP